MHEPSSPVIALSIVAAIVAGTLAFALRGVRKLSMDPQQYIVGGRSLGAVFLWVLLAGEIYTSFTFLGAAGWAYGLGAPAYYILAYGTCGYIIGYFLLPALWRVGKSGNLLTSADFFVDRYGSRPLGIAVACLQFFLLIPYVTLQLSGLQLILTLAGYGTIDATLAVGIAFIVMALFVLTAGLRGTAWASIVKDGLTLAAVAFAGIAIPIAFFGSPAHMIDQLVRAHPDMLVFAVGGQPHGTIWYVTTVLLTSVGFYMGPASMNAIYSARSEEAVRRNAMLLPIYQLIMLLIFVAGFSALLIVPGLKGPDVDRSFLLVVQRYYPAWMLGLVAGAGALAALVPASALLLGAASIVSKNVLGDGFGIATSDRARTLATRVLVLIIALLALGLWLAQRSTLVELLLLYYNGVTQFAPGVFSAFLWKRATPAGVASGIGAGLLVAVAISYPFDHPLLVVPYGINGGFIALLVNIAVLVPVSLFTKRYEPRPIPDGALS